MDKVAEYQYNKGERAYMSFQLNMFLQDIDGNMWPVYSTDDASVKEWHALRAYQDEQRKKGVPIKFDAIEDQFPGPYVVEGIMVTYLCQFGGGVEIQLANLSGATHNTRRIGRFTNFRWREGYPKETQKQTI